MIQGIDHLVVVVRDLAQASRDFEQLGFTVVPGGQHPVGSHNALIAFQDGSYLEIIAFYRDAVDHRWWEPLHKGERLVDFCFQTDDLRADTEKLRGAGVAINNPVPWSRKRPDGYELKWLLSLATGSHRGIAPFLIEDVTPRRERIPQQFAHANGIAGIDKLTVAVGELGPIEKWYRAIWVNPAPPSPTPLSAPKGSASKSDPTPSNSSRRGARRARSSIGCAVSGRRPTRLSSKAAAGPGSSIRASLTAPIFLPDKL